MKCCTLGMGAKNSLEDLCYLFSALGYIFSDHDFRALHLVTKLTLLILGLRKTLEVKGDGEGYNNHGF